MGYDNTTTGIDNSDKSNCPTNVELSDDAELAKQALRDVIRDANAPAAAKAQAARTLAELAGAIGRNAKPPADAGRPLGELTRADLEAELAALSDA